MKTKYLSLILYLLFPLICNINAQNISNDLKSLVVMSREYYNNGDMEKAIEYLNKAKIEYEKIFGKGDSKDYAFLLDNLGYLYYKANDYAKAEPLMKKGIEIDRKILGEEHPDYASSLNILAMLYYAMGRYELAEPLYKKAVEIYRKILGEEHSDYASSLDNLAELYRVMVRYELAEPLYKKTIEIRRKVLGEEHPDYAASLNNLAALYYAMVRYELAEPLYKKAVEIKRKILGEEHPGYATSLNNLASLYQAIGSYELAEPLYKKAMEIRRKILGEEHPDYAASLNNLAFLSYAMGRYESAEPLYKKAMEIIRKTLSEEHPYYASSLNNLAELYRAMGRYELAEPLYKKAMEMRRKILGEEHPDYAMSLNNLATLYRTMGRYELAEPLYKKAVVIYRKKIGEEHPDYAMSLNNLAELYQALGRYELTEPLYKKAVEIRRKILGEEHPDYAMSLYNLANLYNAMERYELAETLYKKAVEIYRKKLGEEHPYYATSLNNLANLYNTMGRYELTEPLYKKAVEIYRKISGEEHPYFATSLYNLATLYYAMGRNESSEQLFIEELAIYIKQLNKNFPYLSEKEKQQFWSTMSNNFTVFNSFAIKRMKENPAIVETMYNNQLVTKGMLLNSTKKVRERIKNSGNQELNKKFDEWLDLKNYINKLYSSTSQELIKRGINRDSIENSANNLEKYLSNASEEFRQAYEKKQYTWRDVQSILKDDECAIEIVRFNLFDKRWTDTVYYAFLIIKKDSKLPELVLFENGNELEGSKPNDIFGKYSIVFKNGESIMSPVYFDAYWKPVQEKLKGIKKVYISLDGIYNKINLNVLLNPETNNYLIKDLDICYLTSTRDLLEVQKKSTEQPSTASIFGYPKYNLDSKEYEKYAMRYDMKREFDYFGSLRDSLARKGIPELPGTKVEVEKIDKILRRNKWKTELFIGEKALEEEIKILNSPTILHISTHGFFYSSKDIYEQYRSGKIGSKKFGMETSKVYENPLLRSGLIFAGADAAFKQEATERKTEDGFLTASEAMNLNLDNTGLVVLSACETGLGDVRNGEGVYGLQRAFIVAGAENLIMSLWKVPDSETQEFMSMFYENWIEKGMSKREAFRKAQLDMLAKDERLIVWGAFVMVGE